MVPVVDLSRRTADLLPAFQAAVTRVATSGQLLLGPETEALEAAVAEMTGRAHAVAVSSGAAAIQLGLAAVGVGPGDEVLVPAFTAVPTASAVCALGAVPVPVEVDPATAALDLAAAAAAVTERTRAVVPVHLYGRPAPLPELGLPVVEDAAQAHGALDPNGPAGVAAAYSFYPTKNVGGIGDGGALVTDDPELARRARRLRVHGMEEQYVHTEIAQNFRLSEVEAAWLRLALHDLAGRNERRRTVAAAYRHAAPGLTWHADHRRHVHHLCVFRTSERTAVRAALADRGVASAVHYPLALTQQPAYQRFARGPCPEAEAWAAECVTVPCFPELSQGEVTTVALALAEVADETGARARADERAR